MKKLLLPVVLLIGLGACAGSFDSPAKTVFQIRSSYTAVLVGAVQYESLDRCPAEPVCSDPDVVDILRKADLTAKDALDAAETTVRDHPQVDATFAIAAAENAVDALRGILTTYKIGVQ